MRYSWGTIVQGDSVHFQVLSLEHVLSGFVVFWFCGCLQVRKCAFVRERCISWWFAAFEGVLLLYVFWCCFPFSHKECFLYVANSHPVYPRAENARLARFGSEVACSKKTALCARAEFAAERVRCHKKTHPAKGRFWPKRLQFCRFSGILRCRFAVSGICGGIGVGMRAFCPRNGHPFFCVAKSTLNLPCLGGF